MNVTAERPRTARTGLLVCFVGALLAFPATSAGAEPTVQSAVLAGQANTTTTASVRLDTGIPPELKAPFPGCDGVQWNWRTSGKSDIYIHADTVYLRSMMYTDYGLIWINILDRNLNVVGGGQYTVSKFENFARTFTAQPGYYASVSITSDDNTITYCGGGSEILT